MYYSRTQTCIKDSIMLKTKNKIGFNRFSKQPALFRQKNQIVDNQNLSRLRFEIPGNH